MKASPDVILTRARRGLRWVTAFFCGGLLIALTLVTVVDVVGRYMFVRPLAGASEYTELLLMAIIFCGLPAVCLDDGHVSVDLLTAKLKGFADQFQLMAGRLFVAVILGIISWQLWKHGSQLASYNEVTVYLRVPIAPFAKAASVICGLCAIVTMVMALMRLSKGREEGI